MVLKFGVMPFTVSILVEFFARAFKSGYCIEKYCITDRLKKRYFKLWNRITTTESALKDLLPPKRNRQLRERAQLEKIRHCE